MEEELDINIWLLPLVLLKILIQSKISKMLGKMLNTPYLLAKIITPGDLTFTNISDSITVTLMEMLTSVSLNILSEEK
jgi:hypothetical protein